VIEFLAGERDRTSMLERIKTRTRQFAKRQGVWFRSLAECRFVEIEGEVDAMALADQIAAAGAT
jgi:tRNA A37 N6-isopentenylltransferase MiaA